MEDARLLVLGAGPAQLGLLASARQLGVRIVAADRNPGAPGFRHAHRRALVSIEDEHALERLAAVELVDGIVAPGSDRSLAIAARIAERLQLPHPLSAATAQAAAARQRQREAFAAAGVAQPAAVVCHSVAEAAAAAERLGFPCVVAAVDRNEEGRVSSGGPADVPRALVAALAGSRTNVCLVEELPQEPELTVTALVEDGTLQPLHVAGRGEPASAVELVAAAAAALGVEHGPVLARVAGGARPCLLSFAPRVGRPEQVAPALAAGVDVHALAVAAALGLEPAAIRSESVDAPSLA